MVVTISPQALWAVIRRAGLTDHADSEYTIFLQTEVAFNVGGNPRHKNEQCFHALNRLADRLIKLHTVQVVGLTKSRPTEYPLLV